MENQNQLYVIVKTASGEKMDIAINNLQFSEDGKCLIAVNDQNIPFARFWNYEYYLLVNKPTPLVEPRQPASNGQAAEAEKEVEKMH